LIIDIQNKYFVNKVITKETYQNSVLEYKKREAELEKALELLDQNAKKPLTKSESQDLELNKKIRELKIKQAELTENVNKLKKSSIDATSIKKMISVLDMIIKKLSTEHIESLDLPSLIAAYNKLQKKYGKVLRLRIRIPPIIKKASHYDKVKLHMVNKIKEVHKHGR
jgi:hypothetical protein